MEAEHAPILGWRGTVGTQFTDGQIETTGEEAVAESRYPGGGFFVERYRFNDQQLEAGARYEHQDLDPDDALAAPR